MKHVFLILAGLCAGCLGCHQSGPPEAPNAAMATLLKEVAAREFFVSSNMYANHRRVAYFDSLMTHGPRDRRASFQFRKAIELLHAGETEASIELLEELLAIKQSSRFVAGMDGDEETQIEHWLALAYLRLGEQENCIHNHDAASCIIPIREEGVHQLPQGSRRALELYEEILTQHPRDLTSRWLLNLAHMTLGTFPDSVPPNWRIPAEAFESEYPLKPFTDRAMQAGLALNTLSGGSVVDDFTGDGYLDVMASEWHPQGQLRFFVNQGDGRFLEQTEAAQLTGITGGINILQTDYNNDGQLDLFIPRGGWLYEAGEFPNSLLRNNGDGTFTDVTEAAGMLSFHPTQTAVWADFDLDGWLDVYIGNESSGPGDVHPCELYLNNQDGTFRELASEAGLALAREQAGQNDFFVKGVIAGDYNRDGREDIYLSMFHPTHSNRLFRNEGLDASGQLRFTDVTEEAGLAEPLSSFPVWFWDYDQDGWEDIFVAGYERSAMFGSIAEDIAAEYLGLPHQATTSRLYRNLGDGTFKDVSEAVGLDKILYAMGANFGDLDNDGWLDMYLSTGEVNLNSLIPNRLFRNDKGQQFQEVTSAAGVGHVQKGHGVSFADIDNDGDQDLHVVMGGAYEGDVFFNALFENPYAETTSWITLQLRGHKANRAAVGARLELDLVEGDSLRTLYRTVNSGGSFGCSPFRQEIGLGNATEVQELRIRWPGDSSVQRMNNLRANGFYVVEEGVDSLQVLSVSAFELGKKEHHP